MNRKSDELQFLDVGEGAAGRRIAFVRRLGIGAGLVWLGGFRSDMMSTKAAAIDVYCAAAGRPLLRFDYSGHGASGGDFLDGTLTRWIEETLALIHNQSEGPQILVGSSMGGHLALLVARALHAERRTDRLKGMVLIAPAVDFTEKLMWARLPPEARRSILQEGVWRMPSAYSEQPYPITRALIDDGRRLQLLDDTIRAYCPVHILQGQRDPDVPFEHMLAVSAKIALDPVAITLVPDGDHRLSRPQDLAALIAAIESVG